jgi:acyl-CoA reductase-like NAD-dependent aldehyde dehydrogenase
VLEIPVLRWGKPYTSLEHVDVVHFETGEPVARIHQANSGLMQMDMRFAQRARDSLRKIPPARLIEMVKHAADLYLNATLPLGNSTQTPAEFCEQQSATTGLPVHMCAGNMKKNHFVLSRMDEILDALTRGLSLDILAQGYGMESRGVMLSYQANSPVLGMVLPSNSPGVHTLWLPVIPMQVGLVLKPGQQEPWTPYRIAEALFQAGIPRESISLYPGAGAEVGARLVELCGRSMIFGGQQTVDKYLGNPKVQVHGPGFSKILFGEDEIDNWEQHLDLMVDSVSQNGGRSCINCSAIYAPRHGREIAEAIAKRIGPIEPLPMKDPNAKLAAFTVHGQAEGVNGQIEEAVRDNPSTVTEVTAKYRNGPRWIHHERHDFLRPTVLHCTTPDVEIAKAEYMFPFVAVVDCPQADMIKSIGYTLVGTALTKDAKWSQQLLDATNIDRLNIGTVKTNALNWLQPHEGNIVEFLFRSRAYQNAPPEAH